MMGAQVHLYVLCRNGNVMNMQTGISIISIMPIQRTTNHMHSQLIRALARGCRVTRAFNRPMTLLLFAVAVH